MSSKNDEEKQIIKILLEIIHNIFQESNFVSAVVTVREI
jgi:hypothetical protein